MSHIKNILGKFRSLNISVFAKLSIFSCTLILLVILLALRYPGLLPSELVAYSIVSLAFLWISGLIAELNYVMFNMYDEFTEDALKYSKSIIAGIAGGFIVSISNNFEINSISTLSEILSGVFGLLVHVSMMLMALVAGMAGFIVIQKHHEEVESDSAR